MQQTTDEDMSSMRTPNADTDALKRVEAEVSHIKNILLKEPSQNEWRVSVETHLQNLERKQGADLGLLEKRIEAALCQMRETIEEQQEIN